MGTAESRRRRFSDFTKARHLDAHSVRPENSPHLRAITRDISEVGCHSRRAQTQNPPPDTPEDSDSSEATTPDSYKEEMLSQLQAFTPAAFERFCADLLKHLGLERVKVTGGTGDKGIDGEGYLPIGPIVTTKIAFQCKRYSGAVSSKEVQSFQGAIGAAEKGIFFTTGYFTDSARDAARSPGCKPIELIDGDRLLELLETHEFGLRPVKTFEVDYTFISNYDRETKEPKT